MANKTPNRRASDQLECKLLDKIDKDLREEIEVLETKLEDSTSKTRILVWVSIVIGILAELVSAYYTGGVSK